MPLSARLSDEQIQALVDDYFDQGAHLSGWTLQARERVARVRTSFFNVEFLEDASDAALIAALTDFYKEVVAIPLRYRAVEQAPGRVRQALLRLLDTDVDLADRVDLVLQPRSPLYQAGLGNQISVLNTESQLIAQRRLAVDLQARALDTRIALAAALGGGWSDDTPQLQPRPH